MKAILEDSTMLTCQYCPRKFNFKKSLEKHEFIHQTDPDNPKILKVRKYVQNNTGRIPMGNYQCDCCTPSFRLYSALERHMEVHMLAASMKPENKQDELINHGLSLKRNEIRDGAVM